VLLAADEASLYLQATMKRVWANKGHTPVVRVNAGRDNTHFYGALNLRTGQETLFCSKLMNSAVSALFLQRLLEAYPDVPLLLLWDRATWHKGEAVKAVLEANPRLEVLWFPPGCPELNPQEHVWKAAREAVSHNHQCATLSILAEEFETYVQTTTFPCPLLEQHNFSALCTMFN
jgi:transposase